MDEKIHCVICLKTIPRTRSFCKLKCGHQYHSRCIQQWLIRKNRCPICNSNETTCQHNFHSRSVNLDMIETYKKLVKDQNETITELQNNYQPTIVVNVVLELDESSSNNDTREDEIGVN